VLGYTENIWGGFNLNHLMSLAPALKDDYRYSDLHFSLFGGIKITTKWSFKNRNTETLHLAFNFRSQSKVNQLDLGGYYFKNPLLWDMVPWAAHWEYLYYQRCADFPPGG
jgi:hypothetical protein